jgi:DNA-binding transcriptional LysR family regulator
MQPTAPSASTASLKLDWHQVRVFLTIADTGAISTAAAALRITQPTLSRALRALEASLGYELFVRHARGVRLTPAGAQLLDAARQVDAAMSSFERAANASAQAPTTLRIAASEAIGVEVIAPAIPALRERAPTIAVELILENTSSDLTRGEADIAVRLYRPEQLDLLTRRVGAVPIGLFASRSYLERRSAPRTLDELLHDHDLIGFDPRGPLADALSRFDPRLSPEHPIVRADSLSAQLAAARAGCGVCVLQHPIARRYPELEHILPALPIEPLELWLTTHQDLRTSPAVRIGLDWLHQALSSYLAS